MDLIAKAVFKDGKLIFRNPQDVMRYGIERDGVAQIVTFKDEILLSEKQKMYNYLHAVLVPLAVMALTKDGWERVDEYQGYHYLKAENAKEVRVNTRTGEEMTMVKDGREMNKKRLHKFLSDAIWLLEERHGIFAPDAAEYKLSKS